MCGITVRTFKWWKRVRRMSRGNGRAQHFREDCWDTDFETLQKSNPRLYQATKNRYGTWREAQQQGDFCQCGPAVLCSDCLMEIEPVPTYNYSDRNRIVRKPYLTYSHLDDYYVPPPHYECKGCTVLLGPAERHITNFSCHLCNLPMRMRNADHPLERQSKVPTAFRDDENYNTLRLGADYDSVDEYWKYIWEYAVCEESRYPPPLLELWEPIEFAWERFNKACLIPTEKRNALVQEKRSAYFQPLRTPVWDFEKILFEPPPLKICYHRWQKILGYVTSPTPSPFPILYGKILTLQQRLPFRRLQAATDDVQGIL
jgi:hypothetical protein